MSARTPPITPRPAPRRVLEDATGRRLHRMRWVGRAVALLFLVWLVIVILGGLGVGPVNRLPLGHILRPSSGPPPLPPALHPRQPTPADLVPARPAAGSPGASGSAKRRHARGTRAGSRGRSSSAPGHTKTTTTHGKSKTAPGHTKTTTTHGKSATTPGHTKTTTTHGKSATTPGHTRTTTTTTAPVKKHATGVKP
jgi:hypothetical protein